MRESTASRCCLEYCTSGLPARPYPNGLLCRVHDPSALAGTPHPDQIAAKSRANWAASVAASTTTKEAA